MDKSITIRIVGIVLTLWNIIGVGSFTHDFFMSPAQRAALPAAQAMMYGGMASWEWAVYGIGTITGLIGAICILLKKRWAAPLSLISLIMVVIQFTQSALRHSGAQPWEPGAIVFVGVILVIAALQLFLAHRWKIKGLLA